LFFGAGVRWGGPGCGLYHRYVMVGVRHAGAPGSVPGRRPAAQGVRVGSVCGVCGVCGGRYVSLRPLDSSRGVSVR
jgi:hypothetical protein